MAPPSGPQLPVASLLDLSLRWANEQRLEELYQLYLRRTHVMPGPGAHDVRSPAALRCADLVVRECALAQSLMRVSCAGGGGRWQASEGFSPAAAQGQPRRSFPDCSR